MDVRQQFIEAVLTGREIEFRHGARHYFESRTSQRDWQIYCEETKEIQHFASSLELLEHAELQGRPIREIWDEIFIDYIF